MYKSEKHRRRSVRLRGYDYSQPGEYFVTLCTHEMQMLFGRVIDGRMELNSYGKIADDEWRRSTAIRSEIELDEWVVMPNHIHGIIRLIDVDGRGARPCAPTARIAALDAGTHGRTPLQPVGTRRIPPRRPKSLPSFVAGLKPAVKVRINELRHSPGAPVWERNYHEHIIRSPQELDIIRDYIRHNPLRWACDRYNPTRGVLVLDADGHLRNWM
ncbi:MAG: hypothetical protein LAO04_14615 [Acidobacteriia bacterium]|nr:hypothetical protein [Terriglobia bacterium]